MQRWIDRYTRSPSGSARDRASGSRSRAQWQTEVRLCGSSREERPRQIEAVDVTSHSGRPRRAFLSVERVAEAGGAETSLQSDGTALSGIARKAATHTVETQRVPRTHHKRSALSRKEAQNSAVELRCPRDADARCEVVFIRLVVIGFAVYSAGGLCRQKWHRHRVQRGVMGIAPALAHILNPVDLKSGSLVRRCSKTIKKTGIHCRVGVQT